jgi:hypothetical protein
MFLFRKVGKVLARLLLQSAFPALFHHIFSLLLYVHIMTDSGRYCADQMLLFCLITLSLFKSHLKCHYFIILTQNKVLPFKTTHIHTPSHIVLCLYDASLSMTHELFSFLFHSLSSLFFCFCIIFFDLKKGNSATCHVPSANINSGITYSEVVRSKKWPS